MNNRRVVCIVIAAIISSSIATSIVWNELSARESMLRDVPPIEVVSRPLPKDEWQYLDSIEINLPGHEYHGRRGFIGSTKPDSIGRWKVGISDLNGDYLRAMVHPRHIINKVKGRR